MQSGAAAAFCAAHGLFVPKPSSGVIAVRMTAADLPVLSVSVRWRVGGRWDRHSDSHSLSPGRVHGDRLLAKSAQGVQHRPWRGLIDPVGLSSPPRSGSVGVSCGCRAPQVRPTAEKIVGGGVVICPSQITGIGGLRDLNLECGPSRSVTSWMTSGLVG
jgi:hypothetical protein